MEIALRCHCLSKDECLNLSLLSDSCSASVTPRVIIVISVAIDGYECLQKKIFGLILLEYVENWIMLLRLSPQLIPLMFVS